MKEKRHTFVILAYRESIYLEECIKSLFGQTVKSEIFISTSTPCDYLREIAKKYNLKVFTHNTSGIGADWNYAYSLAKTDYVTLAHQDDIYDSQYVELCLESMNKFSDSLIAYTNYSELRKDKNRGVVSLLIKRVLSNVFVSRGVTGNKIMKKGLVSFGSPILCPSVMYHKKLIGEFEFRTDLVVSLDWEAWWRLAHMEGKFIYLRRELVKHRIHPSMETVVRIQDKKRQIEDKIMFESIWGWPINEILERFYYMSYGSNLG